MVGERGVSISFRRARVDEVLAREMRRCREGELAVFACGGAKICDGVRKAVVERGEGRVAVFWEGAGGS